MWLNDFDQSSSEDVTLGLGCSYQVHSDWTVRLAYFYDLEKYTGGEDQLALLQFYFYGF